MGEVTIVQIADELAFDAASKPYYRVRVQWMLGSHGPFFAYFDKADFSGSAARAELERRASELRALQG